jgi:hypothetical protein
VVASDRVRAVPAREALVQGVSRNRRGRSPSTPGAAPLPLVLRRHQRRVRLRSTAGVSPGEDRAESASDPVSDLGRSRPRRSRHWAAGAGGFCSADPPSPETGSGHFSLSRLSTPSVSGGSSRRIESRLCRLLPHASRGAVRTRADAPMEQARSQRETPACRSYAEVSIGSPALSSGQRP